MTTKERVITVAKDREKDLHRIGGEAKSLFPKNPTSAFNEIIRKLTAEEIQYIDHDLSIKNLSEHLGHWYFSKRDKGNDYPT
ncbi:MAG: hypothetical protein AAF228_05995 [Pseudomonadota bacterium]